MTMVNNFVDRVERQAWAQIEKCTIKNPDGSRFFAIAVAIERIARALFLAPMQCIEHIILTVKHSVQYLFVSDSEQKKAHLEAFKKNGTDILKTFFISIPLGFVLNTILAIGECFTMAAVPLQTVKRNIAQLDAKAYTQIAPEHESFLEGAFSRFEAQLQDSLKKDAKIQAADLHFMDTEDAREKLIAEFKAKEAVLKRELAAYNLLEKNVNNATQWELFKAALSKVDLADVEGMKFIPNLVHPAVATA